MNSYYLTLVLKPELEEKARQVLVGEIRGKITGANGKVGKEDAWGARELAYPIKRQVKGFYVHFEFETEPQVAKSIDKTLKVEEDILRYLLIRV